MIERRVATRKPAAYLVNKIYMRGLPFYVDERVIVPRSFIGELLDSHFGGEDGSLIDDPADVASVLDLCTGSGCLAILASRHFPQAQIDAVDLSKDALAVAARNVADYGLEERITLYKGDLFKPLGDTRYDLIITNPPYVDAQGMADLPRGMPVRTENGVRRRRRRAGYRPAHSRRGRTASDAAGRLVVRDRPRPRLRRGRFSASAAALARHGRFRGRSVLDRREAAGAYP